MFYRSEVRPWVSMGYKSAEVSSLLEALQSTYTFRLVHRIQFIVVVELMSQFSFCLSARFCSQLPGPPAFFCTQIPFSFKPEKMTCVILMPLCYAFSFAISLSLTLCLPLLILRGHVLYGVMHNPRQASHFKVSWFAILILSAKSLLLYKVNIYTLIVVTPMGEDHGTKVCSLSHLA